ncbi:hypothetical protein ABLE92_10825 [Gordonia sp. VNQ95]|jgi:hypothetical protein|uniref:hypothetical protein n=1 Tax=Gordonia sp. VNQ95 TaxID=3156619 RepID=UPI0032B50D70
MTTMLTEPPRRTTTSRFLTPGDGEWTDDGAGTWLTGHAGGLSYSVAEPANRDSHLTVHNRGCRNLAVLSTPGFAGTTGTRFTMLPSGSSAALPDVEFHILQGERRDGRPVLVGQIIDDDEPCVLLHSPSPGDVDWSVIHGVDEFWTPRTSPAVDGTATGEWDVGEPVQAADAGVECTHTGGLTVVHNRGDRRIAVLMTGLGGAYDLVVAHPGESIPLPPGPGIHYVQAARRHGRPVVVDVIHLVGGR